VLLSAAGTLASAQQSGGLGGAMQLFNGMSPDQQQSILQRLGGAQGGPAQNANSGPTPQNAGAANSQGNSHPPASNQAPTISIPQFLPDDALLLQINLPGEKTVAQMAADGYARELNAAALQALTGQALPASALPSPTPAQIATQAGAQSAAASASAQAMLSANAPTLPAGAAPANGMAPGAPGNNVPLTLREQQDLESQRALIKVLRAGNPYLLDRSGALQLPGFRPIQLGGLTEAEATRRLAAEPALQDFEVKVLRLPLTKTGTKGLLPYGYDLFANGQQGMAPVNSTPVPADYVVGPDDVLYVQLYGNQNYTLQLNVNRDGSINFPQLGPVSVGGQRYSAVKESLEARVQKQMIGVRASVSIGETRTINVFVLGEALYPGSYTVTGLATVTSALFAAGGVKPQGSLRRIQVRRQGALVREFDLYDLLMRGDSSGDVKLLPGDVIMIPAIGPTASVDGEVQRPAIYELKAVATVNDLISMAGGLTPEADATTAALVHVTATHQRVVIGVNVDSPSAATQQVGNGDALRVARLRPQIDAGVSVQGYVWRPGNFAWHEGLRLADIIGNVDELRPNADQHYLLIHREQSPGRVISVLSADLAAALSNTASPANVELRPRDTITVFDLQTGRDRIIEPLMQELALQSSLQQPTEVVHVDGKVKVPGDYPLETGMRVSDLIRAGGSLDPSAYGGRAELSRFTIEQGEQRRTEIVAIDLAAVARGDSTADVLLNPFDQLSVKEISGWSEQDQVTLTGEVRFPGTYTIKRGETLQSVIRRAGGLTDLAFAEGSVFTRDELKVREQEQLDRLADRMRSDVTSVSMMAARAGQASAVAAYNVGQSLLAQIAATKAVGRLVIDLNASLRATPGSYNDIVLRNGDQLIVPKKRQDVMVLGEVQSPSSHLFEPGLSRDDYVGQSGGTTRQADHSKIYVVRADGSVVANRGGFMRRDSGVVMHPGDAVVVPLDTERLPALPLWQSVTQILYNIAIAAAAVHSL
jgi:protein involved in polysaccharide export with SLBB domain